MLEDKRLDKDVPIPLYFQLEKLILEEIDRPVVAKIHGPAVGAGLDEENPSEAVDIAGTIEGLVAAMPEANTCPEMLENLFPAIRRPPAMSPFPST